jgi:predicted CoA-binding protein
MPVTADDQLRRILDSARTIAIVGLSDREDRSSYGIGEFLYDRGYDVVPVNPNISEFHGIPAVASLADIEVPIDIANVFRRAEFTPDIARDAVQVGAGSLWLQLGIENDAAMEIAETGGLDAVQDRCIAVTYRMLGLD